TPNRLKLDEEKFQIQQAYESIKKLVRQIDVTLEQHAESLETRSDKKLAAMEKKMLRAEKRKFENAKNQLSKLITVLAPGGGLQERTENFMLLYAKWGSGLFEMLYDNSLTLEQEFCVITEADS
ncbi:MAG: bacillithiol biosynthesis BshC, partial [Bacteroidota bacterium]|nr:bacillithiol biosynthesis BshC [Bacteroidota bacterium]